MNKKMLEEKIVSILWFFCKVLFIYGLFLVVKAHKKDKLWVAMVLVMN